MGDQVQQGRGDRMNFPGAMIAQKSVERRQSLRNLTYLAGRVVFLPLYAAGTPWLRTLSWNAATLGLVMVMIAVIWQP